MARKTLTPDEKDNIVLLKLERVPVRQIAERVGCTTNTVQQTWNRYLKSRSQERRENLEAAFEDVIARLEKNATDARHGYVRARQAGNDSDATRYLNAERAALVELSKLGVTRDDEPLQAARVLAAKAEVGAEFVRVLTAALRTVDGLPEAQARVIVGEVVDGLRALEA